jgi:hypothetical protein
MNGQAANSIFGGNSLPRPIYSRPAPIPLDLSENDIDQLICETGGGPTSHFNLKRTTISIIDT